MVKFYTILTLILLSSSAFADQTIVTPSGYTMSSGYDAEVIQTVSGRPRTISQISAGVSYLQVQATYLDRPSNNELSLGLQALVLPETFTTPSVSIGINDIANSNGSFVADGFYGRSYFLAVSKSLDTSLNPPAIHGVTLTGGVGAGSYHGFFGGISAQLPLNLIGTTEYDSRSLNYRLAIRTSRQTRLSFDRIGGENWLSINFQSQVSM